MIVTNRALLLGLLLFAVSTSAQAHGEGEIIRGVVVIAALCGGIGGIVTGAMGRSQGAGLLVSLGVLFSIAFLFGVYGLAALIHGSLSVPLFLGMLFGAFVFVGFAGAIPLAIVFLVTYRLSAYIRSRSRDDPKSDATAP